MTDEEHRHRCEVRHLLACRVKKGREWLRDELREIERIRGKASRARLEDDILRQWRLGNRGAWGDWREDGVAKIP